MQCAIIIFMLLLYFKTIDWPVKAVNHSKTASYNKMNCMCLFSAGINYSCYNAITELQFQFFYYSFLLENTKKNVCYCF